MPRRRLILPNVAAFQPAGAIHRSEPTGDMAKEPESSANEPRANFETPARRLAQVQKHGAYQAAVAPLLLFNPPDAMAIFSVWNRLPVTAVRKSRSEFSRVGESKYRDEVGGRRPFRVRRRMVFRCLF